MEQRLAALGEIKFGKLDAYTEYIEYGKEMYKSLFFACPSFHVEKFLNGQSTISTAKRAPERQHC